MANIIPEGRYLAEPTPAYGPQRTTTGKTQYIVELAIAEGPHKGMTIEYSRTLDGMAGEPAKYFREALIALGMDPMCDDLTDFVPTKRVQIAVVHEEYNGKVRAKVKYVNRVRGQDKADPALLAALRRQFKALRTGQPVEGDPVDGAGLGGSPFDAANDDAGLDATGSDDFGF